MASTLKLNIQVTPQEILQSSSTQGTDLGAFATAGDGRGFRYAKIGAVATVAGKLYQGPAQDTTNQNPSGGITPVAASAGATSVTLSTALTLTADQLAGGFMAVCVTPGAGYTYKVKGNAAVTPSGSAVVNLEDPIVVALTTTSRVIFNQNPYNGIVIYPGTMTNCIVGVPTSVYPASYYAWIQTRGPVSCLQTGTGTVGTALGALAGGTAGSLAPAIAGTPIIAHAIGTNVTGEYDLVNLLLD